MPPFLPLSLAVALARLRQGFAHRLRLTAWDGLVAARSAAGSAMACAVACLVAAATDEGGVGWGTRFGRTLPVVPACAALGAWAALAPVRSRGERRALEALGRSPAQIGKGAVAGAAALVLAAAASLATVRGVDATGFYPSATRPRTWQWEGDAFVDPARGLRVSADGAPERLPYATAASLSGPIPPYGRLAAALAISAAGIALPLLVAQRMLEGSPHRRASARRRRSSAPVAAAAGGAVVASVLCFQAAASRLLPALLGAVPPALLLGVSLWRYALRKS
jgi:hypothetical protein